MVAYSFFRLYFATPLMDDRKCDNIFKTIYITFFRERISTSCVGCMLLVLVKVVNCGISCGKIACRICDTGCIQYIAPICAE